MMSVGEIVILCVFGVITVVAAGCNMLGMIWSGPPSGDKTCHRRKAQPEAE